MALGCLLAIAHGVRQWNETPSVDVMLRMSATTGGNGQFFPKGHGGYTETTAKMFTLVGDGQPHEYSAELGYLSPPGVFRLDPGTGPGLVEIHAIQVRSWRTTVRLEGPALRSAVTPLNQLEPHAGSSRTLSFRSQGDDPYLEIALPTGLLDGNHARQQLGLLLALCGGAGLAILLWGGRTRLRRLATGVARRDPLPLALVTAVVGLILLAVLRTGCDGICSVDGVRYGAALMVAALGLCLVGAASMQVLGLGNAFRRGRIFLWIGVGQLALIVYVFLRSALHAAVPWIPLTASELAVIVVAAAIFLWTRLPAGGKRPSARNAAWLTIEVTLLAVVCLVVADRELPRLIMLSSDPDVHAYLARQLDLLGGLPWRGETVFGYPGGTAAFIFIWTKLSLLDVRNATTALPLLQSFMAALMLGEALATRVRSLPSRLLTMMVVLGVTAAGFLIPLYASFSHMQGMGRQIAIGAAAVVPAILLSSRRPSPGAQWPMALLVLASLFVMAVINPISAIVPIILVVAYALYVLVACRRLSWWLAALPGLVVLLMLDPYYFQMAWGSNPSVPRITINDAMSVMTVPEVLSAWGKVHAAHPLRFLSQSGSMGLGQAAPMFGIFLAVLLALRFWLQPRLRVNGPALLALAMAILAMVAADGLFTALGGDRRFYLLAPYYLFTLAQLKILLITALSGSVIVAAWVRGWRLPMLATIGVLLVLLVNIGMRGTQRYHFEPRADYCGALGCLSKDDADVLRDFEDMMKAPDASTDSPRVLVPNSVHDTANEDWVFPVAGARALPFHDVPTAAFYYYQGDVDFTTENYKAHVCAQFDRAWLKRQNVAYVFLPSFRGAACLHDMESLPSTEQVLIRHGNSYLLRLR